MIKKLRIRFVLVSMLSVIIVLGTIMFITNVINYSKVTKRADKILEILSENDGTFNIPILGTKPSGPVSIETPYETRFFSVKLYDNGMITADTRQIAAVDEFAAISYANEILSNGKDNDFYDKYRFLVSTKEEYTLVLFVDCSRQLETTTNFFKTSIWVSVIGLVSILGLLIIFSKPVISPIAKSYERQKRFITDASHELKTPLTIISANAELIEMKDGETEETRAIIKQIVRLSTMVKNLTALSKIDERERLDQAKTFSLTDAVVDITENFKGTFINSKLDFNSHIEEGINYFGDENLIRQLLNIVLENANKYASNKISLVLEKSNKINLIVTNDVVSTEVGNLNRYFERFYRNEENRIGVDGSGIGLSLAKEIVNLHKGEIQAMGLDKTTFQIKITL